MFSQVKVPIRAAVIDAKSNCTLGGRCEDEALVISAEAPSIDTRRGANEVLCALPPPEVSYLTKCSTKAARRPRRNGSLIDS